MIDFIKDADCTKDTPVRLGVPDAPIYGKGIKLKPRVDGRTDSEHFKKIYLPELLPLEEYDLIVVLISGGKDSVACYLKLLELGVPKERIEFWHHDIDGGHPSRRMDWKCTQNYVKALADAEGIKLRVSYRVNGFFGELYRIGASEPIEWIDPDTGEVRQCKLSSNYLKCKELKEQATEEMEELLKQYGYRMKFPAKTGDLSRRWCSAYLKICVADTVVSNLDRLGELEELGGKRHKFPAKGGTHSGRWCSGNLKAAVQDSVTANLEETKHDKKILIVSGERRGESAGRSKYNEMEIHRWCISWCRRWFMLGRGDEVKKIVAAWIEQILEFPTKLEYLAYMESLKKGRPQKFKETSFEQLESGVVRITIRKQYNNNAFPDDEKEGEK